jgi:hypothetical protein
MSGIIDYCIENGFLSFNVITDTLYKYVNVETAKLILQNATLKFSTADEFNDPFELTCEGIDVRASNQDVKELIKRTHPGTTKEKNNSLRIILKIKLLQRLQCNHN